MQTMFTIFAEDTLGVIGFIIFGIVVYNLLGIVLRKYSGRGLRTRAAERRSSPLRSFLRRLTHGRSADTMPSGRPADSLDTEDSDAGAA